MEKQKTAGNDGYTLVIIVVSGTGRSIFNTKERYFRFIFVKLIRKYAPTHTHTHQNKTKCVHMHHYRNEGTYLNETV